MPLHFDHLTLTDRRQFRLYLFEVRASLAKRIEIATKKIKISFKFCDQRLKLTLFSLIFLSAFPPSVYRKCQENASDDRDALGTDMSPWDAL